MIAGKLSDTGWGAAPRSNLSRSCDLEICKFDRAGLTFSAVTGCKARMGWKRLALLQPG